MRGVLVIIGVLMIVGGASAVVRHKPYVVIHQGAPIVTPGSEVYAPQTIHRIGARIIGYAAIGLGAVVLVLAATLKISRPEPHGNPLSHDM